MNNREIFRKNLNDLLSSSGKLQKELAEFVGAKTTTVSGWTRGVSYPRADAMEKIALFFGVPTSRLVGQADSVPPENEHSLSGEEVNPKVLAVSSAIQELSENEQDEVIDLVLIYINNIVKRRKG